jgi:two-component sensor histidine kinase
LVETLRGRVALLNRVHTASVTFEVKNWQPEPLPRKTEEAVLRIAEEALHNALRHASATRVTVTLTGTKLDTQPDSEPDTQPDSEPDTQPGSEPDIKPGSKPDTKPGSEPDAKSGSELESEPGGEPARELGSEPGSGPDTAIGKESGVTLEITDDGSGFDTAGAAGSSNRLGLASMRERSRSVHGSLTITSTVDAGTTVRLVVPNG